MTARIMDGTATADELYGRVTEQATAFLAINRTATAAGDSAGGRRSSFTYLCADEAQSLHAGGDRIALVWSWPHRSSVQAR